MATVRLEHPDTGNVRVTGAESAQRYLDAGFVVVEGELSSADTAETADDDTTEEVHE